MRRRYTQACDAIRFKFGVGRIEIPKFAAPIERVVYVAQIDLISDNNIILLSDDRKFLINMASD